MSDTPLATEQRYRALLMGRSPGERMTMAAGMFDSARLMMRARIKADHPAAAEGEVRARMFEQTYGNDFTELERARIINLLAGRQSQPD